MIPPFRVKIHEENVPYYIRRVNITSLMRADFTIMHNTIMRHKYSVVRPYQGRVFVSEEEAVTDRAANGIRRAALKNGRDVITILEQQGDVVEYLDEPGLMGKNVITPHVESDTCGVGLCDENGWRDSVRCGNIVYVGFRAKYLDASGAGTIGDENE